jgi:protein subunit release factor B
MVKDHETGYESGNPEKVLAGELDDFIDASAQGGVQ